MAGPKLAVKESTMNILETYAKLSKIPFGKSLFSWITCRQAPYFSSIGPLIEELSETHCVVLMKKRKSVLNHIGTMHAIAMCNACELAMGVTMQAGLPQHLRWIPKGMTVSYLKKGETDLRAVCEIPQMRSIQAGDNPIPVTVYDLNKNIIMTASINIYISEKPKKT
jgi:acyl-coenzyme A thioesterase PaaI-like protein